MKKILAIVFASILALAVLAGCTPAVTPAPSNPTDAPAPGNPTDAPAPANPTAAPGFEPKEYTLALGFPNTGIPMLEVVSHNLEIFAGKTNGKITYADNMGVGSNPDACISFVEQSIAAGVDGIVFCPPADSVLPTICQKCEEAQVYWAISMRSINDENVKALCEASEYFCGNVYEDEYEVGFAAGQMAKEAGYKKVGLISTAVGNTTGDLREQGFIDAFGAEFVAQARNHTQASEVGDDVASMLVANPDLDMIFQAASFATGAADAAIAKIKEAGANVKYNCVDGPQDPEGAFGSGIMEWFITGTGNYPTFADPMITCIKVMNAIQGFKLVDEGKTFSYTKMAPKVFTNIEEAMVMMPMNVNPQFEYFDDATIDTLFAWTNPELTGAKFQEIISNYVPATMSPFFKK